MGRSFDELLSYVSDAAALLTGNPLLAVAGNAGASADSAIGGRGKDAVGFGVNAAGAELGNVLGQAGAQAGSAAAGQSGEGLNLASQVTGQTPGFLATHAADPLTSALSTIGSAAGTVGGYAGAQELASPLSKILGVSSGGAPSAAAATAPTSSSGGGGGAGPGGAPGGLDIKGTTAPSVYPWVSAGSGSAPAQGTPIASGGAPMQQAKGI